MDMKRDCARWTYQLDDRVELLRISFGRGRIFRYVGTVSPLARCDILQVISEMTI